MIYIHPYPKRHFDLSYKSKPKPNILREYERAGATIAREGKHWLIRFDAASLKQFYLKDVLMHELGHHVDAMYYGKKSNKQAELFAEWFAVEYGYKGLHRQSLTTA